MEKLFHLKEHGTNVKTEILAGITTFLAMAYILAVNPAILGQAHMSHQGVFLATAISAGVTSIFMGLIANYPPYLLHQVWVLTHYSQINNSVEATTL